jgi:hypothetical protein
MPMNDDMVLSIMNALRSNPVEYLSKNRIKIAGGDRGGPSSDQGWEISFKAGSNDSVVVFDANSTTAPQIKAHAVAMHNMAGDDRGLAHPAKLGALTINALPFYALDNKGSDVMMTGQLTACTFVMLKKAGKVYCTHLEPGGTGLYKNGPELEKELKKNGRFQGHAEAPVCWGKSKYADPMVAYIVGVRGGDKNWKIYAQLRPKGNDTAAPKVVEILK